MSRRTQVLNTAIQSTPLQQQGYSAGGFGGGSNLISQPGGFINGSGTFTVITDFKPTAYYSGGTSVPVWSDAMGLLWSSTWDLGALHH